MKTINVIRVSQVDVSDRFDRIPAVGRASELSNFDDAGATYSKEYTGEIKTLETWLAFDRSFVESLSPDLGQLAADKIQQGDLAATFKVVDFTGGTSHVQTRLKLSWAAENSDAEVMINMILAQERNKLEVRISELEQKTAEANAAAATKELRVNSLIAENSMLKSKSKMVTQVAFIGIAVMAVTQILTFMTLG